MITEDFQELAQGLRTENMERDMMRIMSSLVYDWLVSTLIINVWKPWNKIYKFRLVSAGDDNLARKFKEEVSPESLPPNALRLADIVKIYQKENTPRKRKAGPLMSERDAKKARKVWREDNFLELETHWYTSSFLKPRIRFLLRRRCLSPNVSLLMLLPNLLLRRRKTAQKKTTVATKKSMHSWVRLQ